LKEIIPIGFFVSLALASNVDGIGQKYSNETGNRLSKMSVGKAADDRASGAIYFPEANAIGVETRHHAPRSPDESGAIALPLIIGIVLFVLSLYLWFVVKKKQLMTEQLNILRADLASLFENAPVGYHSVDERGYFISVNNTLCQWLGYKKNELIGKVRFTDLAEADDLSGIEGLLREKGYVDLSLRKKEGGIITVMLSTVERSGSRGESSRVLYSTIDNTRCKMALDRMKTLDQELEAFSYSISHDLRAPLRSIDGYSRILQEDYIDKFDEEGRRVLNVIMSNAKRMGKLIDDLLEFARLGRKSIQGSVIDMTAMVNTIIQELLAQEPERNIDVQVHQLHPAYADVDMMRQVWFNLLENAIKYTGKREAARVTVRSYKTEEGEIFYEVRDNGEGFDMKYVGKLFGVFQRLHKIQDFSGTGVGLAIVKRIISRHGGRVWAEGALNTGAVFSFTIPFEDENK